MESRERSQSKGQKQEWTHKLEDEEGMRAKHAEVAEGVAGMVNHEVSLLEVLFKEPTSSMCSDSSWGWALELTHLGLDPLVLTLSRLGCFGFLIENFIEIMVGPHAILKK